MYQGQVSEMVSKVWINVFSVIIIAMGAWHFNTIWQASTQQAANIAEAKVESRAEFEAMQKVTEEHMNKISSAVDELREEIMSLREEVTGNHGTNAFGTNAPGTNANLNLKDYGQQIQEQKQIYLNEKKH